MNDRHIERYPRVILTVKVIYVTSQLNPAGRISSLQKLLWQQLFNISLTGFLFSIVHFGNSMQQIHQPSKFGANYSNAEDDNGNLRPIPVLKKINHRGQHKPLSLGRRRNLAAKITVKLLGFRAWHRMPLSSRKPT